VNDCRNSDPISSKLDEWNRPIKNFMTEEASSMGGIPVVILIRTDTTLDHSQKAEKV
jgi:hypothetical protein